MNRLQLTNSHASTPILVPEKRTVHLVPNNDTGSATYESEKECLHYLDSENAKLKEQLLVQERNMKSLLEYVEYLAGETKCMQDRINKMTPNVCTSYVNVNELARHFQLRPYNFEDWKADPAMFKWRYMHLPVDKYYKWQEEHNLLDFKCNAKSSQVDDGKKRKFRLLPLKTGQLEEEMIEQDE
jgi:hypothetical protein